MRSRRTKPAFILVTLISLICSSLGADQTHRSEYAAAVDAKGVLHRGSEYHDKAPPWITDQVKAMGPEYPYLDRRHYNQGAGLFRLTLDLTTGAVINVAVIKSTGFGSLDRSAVVALRQWRWRPGKWKQIDMPVNFKMTTVHRGPPPGAILLPHP